eukprot:2430479-Prymnesium_polylepis.1
MESMTLRVPALDRQRTASWGQACAQTERMETRTKMIESTRRSMLRLHTSRHGTRGDATRCSGSTVP